MEYQKLANFIGLPTYLGNKRSIVKWLYLDRSILYYRSLIGRKTQVNSAVIKHGLDFLLVTKPNHTVSYLINQYLAENGDQMTELKHTYNKVQILAQETNVDVLYCICRPTTHVNF